MTTELHDINSRLESFVSGPTARVSIIVETGYDELGLVATSDGYLRLAQALAEFVSRAQEKRAQAQLTDGVPVSVPSSFGALFVSSEVHVDNALLAETEAEAQQVVAYFQRLSPQAERPAR